MSGDTYQAVYDAAFRKIGHFDGDRLVQEISNRFDFSHLATVVAEEARYTIAQQSRPSVLYRPKISIDGNQWCALYGDDLQDGVAGFGDSPEKAMADFDRAWASALPGKKTDIE